LVADIGEAVVFVWRYQYADISDFRALRVPLLELMEVALATLEMVRNDLNFSADDAFDAPFPGVVVN
jgi:hypothetical protein